MSDLASFAGSWLAAARDPAIAADLERVYEHVAAEVERRGPACWASGRCCNFEKAGHLLYVTGLEAGYTLARALDHASRGRGGEGEEGIEPGGIEASRRITLTQRAVPAVDTARGQGGCPFQVRNLCGAHAVRPLGCRVYFCDRSAQEWQRSLSEAALADIRALHARRGIEYRYAEWRAMLAALASAVPEPEAEP